jgi:hypothetical protein
MTTSNVPLYFKTEKQRSTNLIYEGQSKSKGTFQRKHIYCNCKYTYTILSLCNVIPLDFDAPVQRFTSLLAASLTNFVPRQ